MSKYALSVPTRLCQSDCPASPTIDIVSKDDSKDSGRGVVAGYAMSEHYVTAPTTYPNSCIEGFCDETLGIQATPEHGATLNTSDATVATVTLNPDDGTQPFFIEQVPWFNSRQEQFLQFIQLRKQQRKPAPKKNKAKKRPHTRHKSSIHGELNEDGFKRTLLVNKNITGTTATMTIQHRCSTNIGTSSSADIYTDDRSNNNNALAEDEESVLRESSVSSSSYTESIDTLNALSRTDSGTTDTNSVGYVFVNPSHGQICLSPNLGWFCTKFHLSKGNVSDLHSKRIPSYKGWMVYEKCFLPVGFPSEVGVFKCRPKDLSYLVNLAKGVK